MRFLIINTDYPDFLGWLYGQHPGLENRCYVDQMQARNESLFGVADFYSGNLRKLGHEAWDIHVNNEFMQAAWAREHGIGIGRTIISPYWRKGLQRVKHLATKTPLWHLRPFFHPVIRWLGNRQGTWFHDILAAQIKHYRPDILLNQVMGNVSSDFLLQMKPYVRLVVGQIASAFSPKNSLSVYDLVISSLPSFVEHFRSMGIPSELNRLAFEPKVLARLKHQGIEIPVSFVGSITPVHKMRVQLLEHLCSNLEMNVWGIGFDGLSPNSPILAHYVATSWGMEMYEILHSSKITVNNHEGISGPYANNMRLYEATGVGTLLITDWKENLHEMFEPGKEVVAYRSPEECAELINYYLEHDDERKVIARAGQDRTLREHTYYQRMQELVDIVSKYL